MIELKAKIRKAGNMIQVVPPYVDLLASTLSYRRRVQQGMNAGEAEYHNIEMYEIRQTTEGEEYLAAPAGLLSRVVRTFKAYNVQYEIEELRKRAEWTPDWSQMDDPRPGQEVILAKIASVDRGQIEAPTGDGKTWLIVQLAKVFNKARFVIAVPGIDEAKTIRDRMLSTFPITEVGQVGGGKKDPNKRIVVAVRNSLMKADLRQVDILIYDECHTAGADKTSKALAYAADCKMIGFSATTEMRSDGADMEVEALFGPIIHVTTYEESEERGNIVPIEVDFRSVKYGPSITSRRTDVINRQGLWRNDTRNQMVANDALAEIRSGSQVLVYVRTVEHGLELLKYLPDWVFIYGNMDKTLRKRYESRNVIAPGDHPISTAERTRYQELFAAGDLRKVITTCWHTGVDFPQLNTVVRADGLGNPTLSVQLGGRTSRKHESKTRGKIIDYYDEWDDTLHNRALARGRTYVSKGWTVNRPKRLGRSSRV